MGTGAEEQSRGGRRIWALTIAGSDSGGGAGIAIDLRTMHRLGVFATTAITAVTAQNPAGVHAVAAIDASVVVAQIDAVSSGFAIAAVKTGMLWSAEIIDAVTERLASLQVPLVVDPVMVATSGGRLSTGEVVQAYRRLFRRATVVTPNLDEAAAFGRPIARTESLADAARRLADDLECPVLLKGGHLEGPPCDVLAAPSRTHVWHHDRVEDIDTHGTGCMLSAATAAQLALGHPLSEACARAIAFVHDALLRAADKEGTPRLADVESAVADTGRLRPQVDPTG